jgi:hypothetical protein
MFKGTVYFSGYFIVTRALKKWMEKMCLLPSVGFGQIVLLLYIIAGVDAASQTHAVASAISPIAASVLTFCYRIGCRVERLGFRLRIGDRPRHRFWVQPPAEALSIDPVT